MYFLKDQEIDHLLEMPETHLLHQTGQDLQNVEILDHHEDRLIQDRQEDLQAPDPREELIQDPRSDQETLDRQEDQKVRMTREIVLKKELE